MPIQEQAIIELVAKLDKYNAEIANAGKATSKTQKDIETSFNKITEAMRKANDQSKGLGNGFQGMGRNAGQAGIQIQQFVGQVQGGQSAMLALSQQAADLGIVLGAPLLGAVVGIGAAIGGTLVNSLLDADDAMEDLIPTVDELTSKLDTLTQRQVEFALVKLNEELVENQSQLAKAQNSYDSVSKSLQRQTAFFDENSDRVKELRQEQLEQGFVLDELTKKNNQLTESIRQLNEIQEAQGEDLFFGVDSEKVDELLQISQGFYTQELDLLRERLLAGEAAEKASQDKIFNDYQNFYTKKWKLDEKNVARQKVDNLKNLRSASSLISALGSINQAFFDDNKALNAGLIIADTAAAVMREYKIGGPVAAVAAGLAGAAQLAALNSSSIGGGSVASGGGISTSESRAQAREDDSTITESTNFDLSSGQGTEQVIILKTDDGRTLGEVVFEQQEALRRENVLR